MIEEAIFKILKDDSAVNARVAGRIRPGNLNETDTVPAIVFNETDADIEQTQDGPLDLEQRQFQFDLFAVGYQKAKLLRADVRAALLGYTGLVMGTDIKGVFWVDGRDGYNDSKTLNKYSMILNFYFKET